MFSPPGRTKSVMRRCRSPQDQWRASNGRKSYRRHGAKCWRQGRRSLWARYRKHQDRGRRRRESAKGRRPGFVRASARWRDGHGRFSPASRIVIRGPAAQHHRESALHGGRHRFGSWLVAGPDASPAVNGGRRNETPERLRFLEASAGSFWIWYFSNTAPPSRALLLSSVIVLIGAR